MSFNEYVCEDYLVAIADEMELRTFAIVKLISKFKH